MTGYLEGEFATVAMLVGAFFAGAATVVLACQPSRFVNALAALVGVSGVIAASAAADWLIHN